MQNIHLFCVTERKTTEGALRSAFNNCEMCIKGDIAYR